MALPGKITICELEEDNPQKSYFRIRPVLIMEDGLPVDAASLQTEYGDEGGIRIVPDKNEAMHFKSRMRTLGGYCLLDLTMHPAENEKIRPNKNYSQQKGELNRNIVYSDVICACGSTEVMQVFSSAEEGKGQPAYTQRVLLKEDGILKGPYVPELTPDRMIYGFADDENGMLNAFDSGKIVDVMRGKERVSLYISNTLCEKGKTVQTAQTLDPKEESPEQDPEEIVPAAEVQPNGERKPSFSGETPARRETDEPKAEPEALRLTEANESLHHGEPPRRRHRDEEQKEPRQDRDDAFEKRPRRDFSEGSIGLNPRRSRSLSEVVDYHWRQSRIEHLSAGVSGEAVSNPLVSPIERAKQAVREAWNLPEGRSALLRELRQLENVETLLNVNVKTAVRVNPDEEELNRLEAEKLELLRDIDKLKGDRIRQRSELMEETRIAHAEEITRLEKREQKLRDECLSRERAVQSARQAQAEAEKLLNREAKIKLDNEFLKFAMFTKAAALLKSEENIDIDEYSGTPAVHEPTGAQMISDLRAAFEAGGREISNDEALNYLACLAIGSVVIFSGPTGCGKSYIAHALAGALGLRQNGAWRFTRLESDSEDAKKSVGFREQMQLCDGLTQRFLLLEDINMKQVSDQSRGLLSFADEARELGVTLMMTCLDDQIGYPLQSRLLDRAFFIRLKLPEGDVWRGSSAIPDANSAPTLESVRRVFLAPKDVPAELKSRMELLIRRLGEVGVRITPRALSDMYQYCAAICPLMTEDKVSALDRAVAQRALPHILATARPQALKRLPEILCDLPISLSLLSEPIALPPM